MTDKPPSLVEFAEQNNLVRRCVICPLEQREEIEKAWHEAGIRASAIRLWLQKWGIDVSADKIRGHFERNH